MEDVLEVYQRPQDPSRPLICLDEAAKQLLAHVRAPLPVAPGQPQRVDYEYARQGTAALFMAFEPLAGQRHVFVRAQRTRADFAAVIKTLVDDLYPQAERLVLVLDQLNTHGLASLYAAYPPAEARRLAQKLEIHHTPKHGSWLNMAELELSVLARQCLEERMESQDYLGQQVAAWQQARNAVAPRVDWRFTTADARIKPQRLYPVILP
jgi:DDE superfamily endonuclease